MAAEMDIEAKLPSHESGATTLKPSPDFNPFEEKHQPKPENRSRGLIARASHSLARLPVDSWSWYIWSMTTFAVSTLLRAQASVKGFPGLYALGLIVYLLGLVEYVTLIVVKVNKAIIYKRSLIGSMAEPSEALFFATFWISLYGCITGAIDYAHPAPGSALAKAFVAFYWIYVVCALCGGVGLHLMLAHDGLHEGALQEHGMTPAWLLPCFPFILTGVMAGSLTDSCTPSQLYPVLVAGLLVATMGFLICLPTYALYTLRLYSVGFPEPDKRPSMMIAVGPPSYVPLAYLKMAIAVPSLKDYAIIATDRLIPTIIEILALVISIGIVGLACFYIVMAAISIAARAHKMSFHLTWYAMIFPSVGFLSTIGLIGLLAPSEGVLWVASVGTALLCGLWLVINVAHVKAFVKYWKYI